MAPALAAGRPLVGVGLAVASVLLFAAGDTLTKLLTERHPVELVGAVRFVISLALLASLIAVQPGLRRSATWRVRRRGLALVRALVLVLATLLMGHALRRMPVGETVAIMYLAPFAVLALSSPLLGERVGRAGWLFAAIGFVGVLVILRPGGSLDPVGVALALGLAGCTTAFHLLTRILGRSESALGLLVMVTLTGAVIFGLAALPHVAGPPPLLADLALMGGLGLLFTVGHFLFGAAYREAPPSLIAPANYLHFVFAALMGWGLFAHVPDAPTIAGMVLILLAGTAIALVARR